MSVVRLDNGEEVQLIRGPQRLHATGAMRAPNGDLLLEECNLPACGMGSDGPYVYNWRDQNTGVSFAGDPIAVSPDGSRVATAVIRPDYQMLIRQYDFSTGNVLSELHADGDYAIQRVNWADEGRSLFVVARAGGFYVVPRSSSTLPAQPNVANGLVAGDAKELSNAAMLANGHVVAFESGPIQRPHVSGAFIDIDPATGAHRVVIGAASPDTDVTTKCDPKPQKATRQYPCNLEVTYASIAVRGNDALVTDSNGQIWLYDGTNVRWIRDAGPFSTARW